MFASLFALVLRKDKGAMLQPREKTFTRLALALRLFLGAVGVAYLERRVRWRAQLLAWKLSGSLPYATWPELLKALRPSRMKLHDIPNVSPHFVREKERGAEPCLVLWDTPAGGFWGRPNDHITLKDLLQEQIFLRVYQRDPVTIRAGDIVLDCGSHLGTFSRLALGQGARLVVAFEPEPTNNVCFKRTFRKEIAEGRVILVEAALWETSGTLKFAQDSWSYSGSVLCVPRPEWVPAGIVDVPAVTLDEAVQHLNLDRVDFISWDIEGAERQALRGARQTLARFRPRMVMSIYHHAGDPIVIPRLVLEIVPTYRVFTRELQHAYFY